MQSYVAHNGSVPERAPRPARADASDVVKAARQLAPGEWFYAPHPHSRRAISNRLTQSRHRGNKINQQNLHCYKSVDGRTVVINGDIPERDISASITIHSGNPPKKKMTNRILGTTMTCPYAYAITKLKVWEWILIPPERARSVTQYATTRLRRKLGINVRTYTAESGEGVVIRLPDGDEYGRS